MSSSRLTAADRQRFARARERGRKAAYAAAAVVKARYDKTDDAIELVFRGGTTLTVPRMRVQVLADVPESDLGTVTVSPAGDALSWRSADVDVDVRGLIRELFPGR